MFNNNNKCVLSSLLSVIIFSALFAPFLVSAKQPLNQYIQDVMAERHIPGLQLAVVKDKKIV